MKVPVTAKALKIEESLVITILSSGLTYEAAEDLAVKTGVIE
jgi:hypothetical protein